MRKRKRKPTPKQYKPVRVCWCDSDVMEQISYGTIARVRMIGSKKLIALTNGLELPAEKVFMTANQCRDYYGWPPIDWYASISRLADKLQVLAEEFEAIKHLASLRRR